MPRSRKGSQASAFATDSYKVSPVSKRLSILTDGSDIEQPIRKSWWKRLDENSREIMDVPESSDAVQINNIADEFDVEVISQGQAKPRNYTIDLPESSDGESISSIVLPQRKLFTQKGNNNLQRKFAQIMNNRDSQDCISDIETIEDNEIAPKYLFNQPKQRNKSVFPSGLLNISANETLHKTKEMPAPEVKSQVRSLFGNQPATKRKHTVADFIVSDSEDGIPDVQPTIFSFKKNVEEKRKEGISSQALHHSPISSIDLEMDEWRSLPSSTMIGNQLEDITPVKRARLCKSSEMKESETVSTINNHFYKSMELKNKSKFLSNSKLKEIKAWQQQDVVIEEEPNLSNSRLTRNRSKSIQETSLIKAGSSTSSNISKNITIKDKDIANKTVVNENYENVEQNISVNDGNEIEDNDSEDFTLEYENDDDIAKDADSTNTQNKFKNKNKTVTQLKTQENLNITNNKNKSYKKNKMDEDTVPCGSPEIVSNNQNVNVEKQSIISNIEGTKKVTDSLNVSQHNKSSSRLNSTSSKKNKTLNIENNIVNERETKDVHNQSSHKNDNIEESKNENQDEVDKMMNDQLVKDNESENENQIESQEMEYDSEGQSEQIESEQEQNESEIEIGTKDMGVDEQNESNEENVLNDIQDENNVKNSDEEQENEVSENQPKGDEERLNDSAKENNREITNKEHQNEASEKDVTEKKETSNNDGENNKSENAETEHNNIEENESDIEKTDHDNIERNENEIEQNDEDDDQNEERNGSDNEDNDAENDATVNENNKSPNITNEKGEKLEGITSPENVLHVKTNQINSFTIQGRNTTARKTKNNTLNIRPSLAPARESTGFSDGTRDSSADNSGWDSHKTTRKTLRQTFGKNFTLHKSLRTLVMEQSVKRNTNYMEKADLTDIDNLYVPQANSTEFQHFDPNEEEPMHVDETPEEIIKESEEPVKQNDLEEHKGVEESEQHEKSDEHQESEELEDHLEYERYEKPEDIEDHEEIQEVEEHEVSEGHEETQDREETQEIDEHEVSEEHEELEESNEFEDHREYGRHEETEEIEDHEETQEIQEHEECEDHEETQEIDEHEVGEEHEELEESDEFEDHREYERHEETEEHENQEDHFESGQHEETEELDDHEKREEHQELKEHEASKRTKQTTLELYLQKIKEENLERKRIMQEQVRNSVKTTQHLYNLCAYNLFKVPKKPVPRIKTVDKSKENKKNRILHCLPAEIIEDMKYKPPKRFKPNNASWITKRLYKFLETKLEPKYDYTARVRAEKLVETIYNFTKNIKKQNIAPSHSVDELKNEMARLNVVKTHFDFYEFFNNYMPREIRIKVVPDIVNKIPLPKHGVFADIR